jgi:hypothetical protein
MVEQLPEGRSLRDIVMRAITTFVVIYTDPVSEREENGLKYPVLAISPTGNTLRWFATRRGHSPDHLVRIGANLMVQLLSERVGEESLYDALIRQTKKSGRGLVEEVAHILKAALE